MSKHLKLHLINHQIKVWEKELPQVHTSDKVWHEFVKARIRKLKAKKELFLNGKKLKKIEVIDIPYTKSEETNYKIQNEIDKWYAKNETIETI